MEKIYDNFNSISSNFAQLAGTFSGMAMEMQTQVDRITYLENENEKLKAALKQFTSTMVDLTEKL